MNRCYQKIIVALMITICPLFLSAEKQVPIELAQKVAEQFAAQVFVDANIGLPQLYYGVDNKPAVYVFTVYFGKGTFPSEEEILAIVQDGFNMETRGTELKDKRLALVKNVVYEYN